MAHDRNFIGQFQLVRLIRSGQTTQVWEAKRQGERERVALKVLLRSHRDNKTEIEALKYEAKVGLTLDHPNVIKIYGYHDEYLPLVSMQLYNARNLKVELRDNLEFMAMNMKELIVACVTGLHHLHEKGWVHCDVKPDNFLADEQSNVRLIDFSIALPLKKKGLAGLFGGGNKIKVIRGTRSYMAPEQIRRQNVDARTDIYGLGCVMYEMLSGKAPYSATNPDDLLKKHLRTPVPNMMSIAPVTPEFNKLCMKMIAKNMDDRPDSMLDVLGELKRIRVYRAGGQKRHIESRKKDKEF